MRDAVRTWLLRHWPYALLGDRAMLWFLVILGYASLTGCDPITPIADVSTGGLYSLGRGLTSGDFGKAVGSDLGTAGILESIGKSTAGPLPTQIARTVIGGGAGAAGALGGGASPTFTEGLGSAPATGGPGVAPGFTQGVGSGYTEVPSEYYGLENEVKGPSGGYVLPTKDVLGAGAGAGTVGGFDLRSTPSGGAAPSGDLLPDASGSTPAGPGGLGSKSDMMKALLALQALQTARGLVPGQQQTPPDPNAALADLQAQQDIEKQRAILASLPRDTADLASRGLSGASPEFISSAYGNDPQTLELVMRYLGRGNA